MKTVTPEVQFPQLEQEILAFWHQDQTFYKSLELRKGAKEFTFYDGPPFANGLPHYGHLLANTLKDTVPRYWTMRGYRVDRRFGWDCHGLPVEYEIEKRENLKGRSDILAMGVDLFNEACRASVLHYTKEWQGTITRLGRWVDWDRQYKTMDLGYMESVWWVFGELWRKGLVYRDFKVVPYSPRITAVLSNFEANQNYKEVQDPAITIKFKLLDEDAYVLAWTTTPWTLISNLALCIGPAISYAKVKDHASGQIYYLAAARVEALYKKTGKQPTEKPYELIETVPASALAGRRYQPLFPYFAEHERSFVILTDDYVTTEDGTGVVHQAPAYGEDDFRVCRKAGISLVDPVDEEGRFKAEIPEFKGQFIKDADKEIIRLLKERGQLVRHDQLLHSYPFCDRTDTPLIYKAIQTWYVAVEKIKQNLIDNNQQINWVPEHLQSGRMGKWLEQARDWAISRNRFWGTPIPIWVCDLDPAHMHVVTSAKELGERSGTQVADLHSHKIDRLKFNCTECAGKMARISEVFDCWFESGSMPYAQLHYPFEHQDDFAKRFPADFIAEGLDQTRGWFYTLSVLSAALFQAPAFKNVVVNGMVLAEDGKKMSKRLKNYTAPELLLDRFGADSVRLYMLNSAVLKAGDLCFTDQGVRDTTRAVLLPLWNAYSFLSTYAEADGWQAQEAQGMGTVPQVQDELDQWIISRFQTLCSSVHREMEAYRLYNVVPQVLDFTGDLTNWYIRLSRKRFWGTEEDEGDEAEGDKGSRAVANNNAAAEAYQTLYYILIQFSKVFAPFAPFIAERLYQNLIADLQSGPSLPTSVHLCAIPEARQDLVQPELEERMQLLRIVSGLGRSLRAKHQLKTRQALASMMVVTRQAVGVLTKEKGSELLKQELNVKEVIFSTDESQYVELSLKPNLKTLGPRLGKDLQAMRQHLEALNLKPGGVHALLAELGGDGEALILGHKLKEEDFLISRGPKDGRLIASEGGVTVLLDTRLTPELIMEGRAREVISRIQRLRKERGLSVSDRIELRIVADEELGQAVKTFSDYICRETLATRLMVFSGTERPSDAVEVTIEGFSCAVALSPSQSG